MESPLGTVTELQEALSELRARETQLAGIPGWMQELHDEHSLYQGEITEIEAELEAAGTVRRTAEAEIADYQEKLKTYQEQISSVRNQREYGALLHEIDLVKSAIQQCEERALQALEKQEEDQARLDSKREASTDLDQRYAEAMEKWEAEKPGIASEAEVLRVQVADLESQLPPRVLAIFRRILERHGGEALAPVRKVERVGKGAQMWHCGGCHYRVRPQAVVQIADQGKIVHCDSCKRILILDQESA
jgi:predicted  nucleic acid-binding Zn-ribbon protein